MVINLHVTSRCNYHCRFCFAGFSGTKDLTLEQWKGVVDTIDRDTKAVPKRRINLAGGEPTLLPGFSELCRYIQAKGIAVSVITNGYWLNQNLDSLAVQQFLRKHITMIGLSIDSLDQATNHSLGRCLRNGKGLSQTEYLAMITTLQALGIAVKVNTVITTQNAQQSLAGILDSGLVHRFKILRMSAIDGENNQGWDLLPSDADFDAFVKRHAAYNPVVEGLDAMKGSYIFVNPQGQLVDNSQGTHAYGLSLLTHSFQEAFAKLNFNQTKYDERYQIKY
ncbi:MAG: viperin family antiviral radical SAM protein [Culicoidibacterales bacterium]